MNGACASDAALRTEVEALLAIYDEAETGPAPNADAGNVPPAEGATETGSP
jgi:hypothetical protein